MDSGRRGRRVPARRRRGLRAGPATRARAFGLAQSGLYAVQGLGILAGGAAQAIGAPLAVGLAGLIGVTAATMLAVSWTQLHGH